MPDLVRGPLPPGLDPEVVEAVAHHRRIDRATDTHAATLRSVDRLRPTQGRFSGIVVDLFYDHFLACDWPRYCDQPLGGFIAGVYRDLEAYRPAMPPPVRPICDRMAEQDWLSAYATVAGMELTLRRVSRRLGRFIEPDQAVDDLTTRYADLRRDFETLWRDLTPLAVPGSSALRPDPTPTETTP